MKISETFVSAASPQPIPAGPLSLPQIPLSWKTECPTFIQPGSLSDFLVSHNVFFPLKHALVNFNPFLLIKMLSKGSSGIESKNQCQQAVKLNFSDWKSVSDFLQANAVSDAGRMAMNRAQRHAFVGFTMNSQ